MTAVLKVLLFLLKWLGILLLVVLGLVLLLILVALLAPVRYKGKLDKKEEPEEVFRAEGLVSWLNPLVRVRIRYTEKKLRYTVRILGICLLNSEKPKKEKKRKAKTEKQKKSKKKKKSKDNRPETTQAQGSSEPKPADEGAVPESGVSPEETPSENGVSPESIALSVTPSEEDESTESGENEASETEKKKSLIAKIKAFFAKIRAIPEKIKEKVTHTVNTIKLLWYKKEKVVLFLEDELHKTALGKAWTVVKQLLRHVLPGKIKGHVEFGTGSPESTGKALAVLGILYAAYGKGVTIIPDFYEKRVVAELEFKGRIRLGTILVKVLRLIRDKHVKRFRKNFKKLMNILKQKAE